MTKKITALALAIMMILAFSATAMAAPEGSTVISNELSGTVTVNEEQAPQLSVYEFSTEAPTTLVAHLNNNIKTTLKATTVKDLGYDKVLIKVEVTKPDGAEVDLLATDTNGKEYDIADLGYWGPSTGFPIAANYTATTEITARFSKIGDYTITTKLVDLTKQANDPNYVITSKTDTFNVVEPITMKFVEGDDRLETITKTVTKGQQFEVSVESVNNYKDISDNALPINNTLYIMELKKSDGSTATTADVEIYGPPAQVGGPDQKLGYKDGYFFWGPENGFPFVNDTTSTFKVTFNNAGTYNVAIYAVQLP